jgi:hypothetical protein
MREAGGVATAWPQPAWVRHLPRRREALGGGVVWGRADPDDRPAGPSAWGEGAGSMAGQADPPLSARERERAMSSHHGYSSELRA